MTKHLFIVGCPRSGTTALWGLLSHITEVAIGLERYAGLISAERFSLDIDHFKKARFFDLRAGDTFYNDLSGFDGFYGKLHKLFDSAHYVGDKIPDLFRSLPQLLTVFPKAKIIFLVRNIFEVGASYCKRADNREDTSWPATRRIISAIEDFNAAVSVAHRYLNDNRVFFVPYDLFFREGRGIEKLTDFLELELTAQMKMAYEEHVHQGKVIAHNGFRLSGADIDWVMQKTDFQAYQNLIEKISY